MVKNYASFRIHSQELLNKISPERLLLQDIINELEKEEIHCEEPKNGCFCIYTLCNIDEMKLAIAIFLIQKKSDNTGLSEIHCFNYLKSTWWKRIFKRISPESINIGDKLQYVCDKLKEILTKDTRLSDINWMTYEYRI